MEKKILSKLGIIIATIISLTSCTSFSSPSSSQATQPTTLADSSYAALWQGDKKLIWDKLHHISSSQLAEMQSKVDDPVKAGWIKLVLINKKNSVNTQQLARELLAWREHYLSHPANQLLPSKDTLNQMLASPPPQRIALLLPQSGVYESAGQAVREGFLHAYYANLPNIGKQNVRFYDTTQSPNLISLYQQAVVDGADFIIGPLTKAEVQQLSGSISFNTPTLALNYTDVRYSLPTNFYEYGLLPEDEVGQIAERARQADHLQAIVIAPQTGWGQRMVSTFSTHWKSIGGNIQDTLLYSSRTNFNQDIARLLKIDPNTDKQLMREDNNKTVLEQQRRHDFDVIFLFSPPQDARIIVSLLRYYYTNDIPIYATSAVYSGKPNPTKDVDLNGVIICDIPWHKQMAQEAGKSNIQTNRLYAVGQDAYLLSQTLQRLTYLPNFPIYGTTGALTLSSDHQIHRRLPCMSIKNGLL